MNLSKFKDAIVYFGNSGMKDLTHIGHFLIYSKYSDRPASPNRVDTDEMPQRRIVTASNSSRKHVYVILAPLIPTFI